jgi:hypothetical protein
MGCGSWSSTDWSSYAKSSHISDDKSTVADIYKSSGMKKELNPKGVLRESCSSDDHPKSTPIIIGLDVTGSMGYILEAVAKKLGVLVEEVYKRNPVTDPQIMFNAIGDSTCDDCPLQVTQFESDIRIAEQLTNIYFERGGGGNNFESYPLTWYFAANHTKIDSMKRGQKGFIFTMGDDGYPDELTKSEIEEIFGDKIEANIPVKKLLNQVNQQYEVYHLLLKNGGSYADWQKDKWDKLLGERAISVSDYTKIPEIIVSILEAVGGEKSKEEIIGSWDGSTAIAVKDAISKLSKRSSDGDLVVM